MTSTMSLVPAIETSENLLVKTDELGRMKRTREQREQILDEYERSGLSGPKFAALCGVKYQTFAFWRQQRKRQRKSSASRPAKPGAQTAVRWLEAQVESGGEPSSSTALTVHLPGGARAEITSPGHIDLAAALVRALEKPC